MLEAIEWDNTPIEDVVWKLHEEVNKAIGLNNVEVENKPTLIINAWCHAHIKQLHNEYKSREWLAWCKVEPLGEWKFIMTDMIHPQQKASSWEVETTDEWMERFTNELIERGEDLSQWNCVLHSHHTMGCFRSGTDDKARLWLNDWRERAWAVVTAYSWNVINYKGCVNFYKPYNIEIDCNIEYIDKDYDALCKQAKEDFEQWVEEKYVELLYDNMYLLEDLKNEHNYNNIVQYLWVDITKELQNNYLAISNKLPWKYQDKLNELYTKAVVETKEKYDEKYKDESWYFVWNNTLVKQLMEHLESRYSYSTTPAKSYISEVVQPEIKSEINTWDFDTRVRGRKEEEESIWEHNEEWYDDYNHYYEEDYPTKSSLCFALGIPMSMDVVMVYGEWFAKSEVSGEYELLEKVLEEQYEITEKLYS